MSRIPFLFDPEESQRRKLGGQDRAAENAAEWMDGAMSCMKNLAVCLSEFTADDLALELDRSGIGEPHHPNVYGTLWSKAAGLGWIASTNRTTTSKRPREHYRRIMVWESRLFDCNPRAGSGGGVR